MKSTLVMGALSVLAAIPCVAQSPAVGGRGGVFTMEVPGPGTTDQIKKEFAAQRFTYVASEFSFDGGVVKNAPYSAQAVTETTQRLTDGNRISNKTTATMYRDSAGRTRREETLGVIGPWASSSEPVQSIFISDPVSKTNLILDSRTRTVRKMPSPEIRELRLNGPTGVIGVAGTMVHDVVTNVRVRGTEAGRAVSIASNSATAEFPIGNENEKSESLGARIIEGVRADGVRTTVTIPAGAIGNDLPIETVSERWYSPELQTVIMTSRNDPRTGETVYRLINVNRNEPAPSLFEAPSDYAVVEESGPAWKRMPLPDPAEKRKD